MSSFWLGMTLLFSVPALVALIVAGAYLYCRWTLLDDLLRQLSRVGDGSGAADEGGVGAVEGADPVEAPDHVGDVTAEDAAVLVQLIDDDVA